MLTRDDVHKLIDDERAKQDAEWGGPGHDDHHNPDDWLDFIDKQSRAARITTIGFDGFQERLVKIAALAVAAIEAQDRRAHAPPRSLDPAEDPGF